MATFDSNTDTTIPTASHLHLMNLPQELQDEIFALAYCRSLDTQIITKSSWSAKQSAERQKKTLDAAFVPQPYPGAKVGEFIISKRYFVAACKAYLISQPLNLKKLDNSFNHEPIWATGVIAEFARDIVADREVFPYLFRIKNIRHLQLELRVCDFEGHSGGLPPAYERLYTPSEVQGWPWTALLSYDQSTRLSSMDITVTELNEHLFSVRQLVIFNSNVRNCEELLRSMFTAPRSVEDSLNKDTTHLDLTPLYSESKVRIQTSTISSALTRTEMVEGLRKVITTLTGVVGPELTPRFLKTAVLESLYADTLMCHDAKGCADDETERRLTSILRELGAQERHDTGSKLQQHCTLRELAEKKLIETESDLQRTSSLRALAEQRLLETESELQQNSALREVATLELHDLSMKLSQSECRLRQANRRTKILCGVLLTGLVICALALCVQPPSCGRPGPHRLY